MRLPILALLAVSSLAAADELRLALDAKAQADFDRVQKAVAPQLNDANACIQSQAALFPVTPREGLSALHYRKGYCILAGAAVTHQPGEYLAAAAEFEKAVEHWPARVAVQARKGPPEPLPAGLRVLTAIAWLQAGADDAGMEKARAAIAYAQAAPACASPLFAVGFCDSVLRVGRQWLGWIDLRRDDPYSAVRILAGATPSGWTPLAAGRKAFREGNYPDAALQYRHAVEAWEARQQAGITTLLERLGPAADLHAGYAELGGAQLLAGDPKAAASLTRALKDNPSDARALFLRARARELSGQNEAALTDYNLASRAAFASARDLASGEAHLYRGILLYHRKDYSRAEDEFASALNFEIAAEFRGDAAAWRHLAAVAAGNCAAARFNLEYALASVSPYFPKEEARTRSAACSPSSASLPRPNPPK